MIPYLRISGKATSNDLRSLSSCTKNDPFCYIAVPTKRICYGRAAPLRRRGACLGLLLLAASSACRPPPGAFLGGA
jgi:hypothetical protein